MLRLQSALALAWLAAPVAGQCSTTWSSGAPEAHVAGAAGCSALWDPDGTGPAPERLVIGGQPLVGGSTSTDQRVMTFDGTQWEALASGPGTSGSVLTMTTWNGLLVVAGSFTGGGFDRIALWNGTAWQPLGPGLPFVPSTVTEWNGNLVAGGNIGSMPSIQLWNGVSWSALPQPPQLTAPTAMVAFQGRLWVGGTNGAVSGALARWDGTAWLPTIQANGWITCLAARSFQFTSTLFVGGLFGSIGGTSALRIASTANGTTFIAVGNGLSSDCWGLHVRATSALGTAVVVRVPNAVAPVMQLSGSTFVAMGSTQVSSLSFLGGSYYATAVGTALDACLRYNGSAWTPALGQSLVGEVRTVARSGTDVIVGGTIQSTTGAALNRIARWNGTTFQPIGTGMSGVSVDALAVQENGEIVAGGQFASAGGLTANNIARWNGTAWSVLGTGCNQQVLALCRMPNGDVVAGGRFTTAGGVACARIARWNGTAWSPLGFGMNGDVHALAVRSDGVLFAGGAFTIAGGIGCNRIAQWNGTSWLPLGIGVSGDVHALAVRPNDEIVAVGAFLGAGGLAADRCVRWNGSTWASMAAGSGDPGPARSVVALPNGDVVAGRGFHQPAANPDAGISRWNGSTWSGFGAGVAATTAGVSVAVRALVPRTDGSLIVGGDFGIADGLVAHGLAVLSPTCPALASPYGAGCTAAGPLVIGAETLPWIGSTHRTATTGLTPGSLSVDVIGFTPVSILLSSVLPQGQPGCSLLASPDILSLSLADGTGTARSALAIAPSVSLIGASFFEQSVPLAFDAAGALVAARGSNGLALIIGTL